jgi:hypothetical protein
MNIVKHDNGAVEIIEDNQTTYVKYNNDDRVWWDLVNDKWIVVRVHTYDNIIWDLASCADAPVSAWR